MLKIDKNDEPKFFAEFKKKSNPKSWKDFDFEIKGKLKEYMLENEQKIDGNYFCPYCERQIKIEKSQIEHIKPKDKFPGLFNNYSNFLAGCLENQSCGSIKGNRWDDKFINPVENNPEDYFEYSISTGEIIPKYKTGTEYETAMKTIDMLNLNQKKLCEIRKTMILEILNMNIENIKYINKFPTLKKFLIKNTKFLSKNK